jgi:hypothetical protein
LYDHELPSSNAKAGDRGSAGRPDALVRTAPRVRGRQFGSNRRGPALDWPRTQPTGQLPIDAAHDTNSACGTAICDTLNFDNDSVRYTFAINTIAIINNAACKHSSACQASGFDSGDSAAQAGIINFTDHETKQPDAYWPA